MSKFDLVYEKAYHKLFEREYIDSTFEDNLRLLVKSLKDNDFLSQHKDVDLYIAELAKQPGNVKEIVLDTKEQSLPAMKLRAAQENDSESFSVTAINLEKPNEQKEFANSMLETIFDDVVSYIKSIALQGISPEAAVDQLPPAEGGEAQPEGGESQLPTGPAPSNK